MVADHVVLATAVTQGRIRERPRSGVKDDDSGW